MIPSRGCCHGIFLLCHSARLGNRLTIEDWVESARSRPTFMANALNLEGIANALLELGFASTSSKGINIHSGLSSLSERANHETFLAIARLLIVKAPPFWLSLAVQEKNLHREYIPKEDFDDLEWIEPGLEKFLLGIYENSETGNNDAYLKQLGDAAEVLIFSGLQYIGLKPVHVARFSDAFGYDIEYSNSIGETMRLEIKAASLKTRGNFYLSRNEFDKSKLYGKEWRLIQITFSNSAFFADEISCVHVESIRELEAGALHEIVPADSENFRWDESAFISPGIEKWKTLQLALNPSFVTSGFKK